VRVKDVRIGREYLLRVPTGSWSAPAVFYRVRVREVLPGGRVRLDPQAWNVPEYARARSLRDKGARS